MGIRIGITGPHSGGKTTVLDLLKKEPSLSHINFIGEAIREVEALGFPVNEDGGLATQILVNNIHVTNLLTKDDFICDRTILDGTVYSDYAHDKDANVMPKWFCEYSETIVKEYMDQYDLIFYIPAEFEPVADGFRAVDLDFHKDICERFADKIHMLLEREPEVYCDKVIVIAGTPQQRFETMMEYINKVRAQKVA